MTDIWAWLITPEPTARGVLVVLCLVIAVLLVHEDMRR